MTGEGERGGGVKKKGGGSQSSPITNTATTTTTTKPTTTTAHKRKVAESSTNSSPFLHNTKRQETIPEDGSPYSSSLSFQLDNSTPTQFRHGFRNGSYNGTNTTGTGTIGTNMTVMSTVLKGATWAANGTVVSMRAVLRSVDSGLKNGLKANLDALASLLLILVLMIGTTALALFLSARVAQEGRTAVTTFKNSFPAAWANAAAATFTPRHIDLSPAVIVVHIEGEGEKGDEQQGIGEKDSNEQQQATPLEEQKQEEIDFANRLLLQHQQEEQQLPEWLAKYQKDAIDLAQSSLPGLVRWMDARLVDFVTANNLTAALTDVRLLVETVQGPRRCSERGRENRVVEAARAEVRAAEAERRLKAAEVGLEEARRALSDAVVRSNEMQSSGEEHRSGGKGGSNTNDDKKKISCGIINNNNIGGGTCIHSTTNNKDNNKTSSWLDLQNEIVRADAAVTEARHIHDLASSVSEEAQRTLHSTTARLALCVDNEIDSTRSGRHLAAYDHDHHHMYGEGKEGEMDRKQGTTAGPPSSPLPGLAGELSERLQSGYAKLWRRQLREGVADIKAAAMHAMDALRNATQLPATSGGNASSSSSSGSASAAAADLTALQRLVAAIAEPLLAIGRLIAVYVGSSAAAALMGGLGVLRLGIGVFKIGTQLVLFLALLYYLLAARRDPLLHAAAVLPLSDRGRRRVAAALNRALGGVLSSMLRLVIFHGAFTWLLHSILNAPLVYTTTVASGISALLPFVPTPVVATPSTALLAFYHKKPLKAVVLALAQLAAYWNGDTIILQDVGHAYLMSLGILGGLYAFDNPLQGCILGPVLLSLSSVLYELHSEFMGASSSSQYGGAHNNNNMNTAGMMFRGGGGSPTKVVPNTTIISNTGSPSGMPSLRVDVPSPAGGGPIQGALGKEGEEEGEEASLAVHVVEVEEVDSDEVVSQHRPGSSGMGSGSSFSFLQHQDGKTKSE
jgi:predicted PurR-regulated permease PerM